MILSQPAVAGALMVAFCLVVGTALISAFSIRTVATSGELANLAQETVVALNRLQATLSDAEAAQRGYLLTVDEKYLGPYNSAKTRLPQEFSELRAQFEQRPSSVPALDKLEALIDAKLREMAKGIELLQQQGIKPALDVVESDEGWRLMNEIRLSLQQLQTGELADLAKSSRAAALKAESIQKLNLGLVFLATLLAMGAGFLLVRRMQDLEALITVCSWTRRVKWEGRWLTFEEYLEKRFNLQFTHGISEEAAEKFRAELEMEPDPSEAESRRRAQ